MAAALTGPVGLAQEKKFEPSAREAARIEAMLKAGAPGEAHKKLEPLVGIFNASVKFWSSPSSPPEETSGIVRNAWALDGRFVEQRFEGTLMGQPYSGVGFIGYDNAKRKYTSVWLDTGNTAIMESSGAFDPEGKVLTLTGTMDDPATGKPAKTTQKIFFAGKDGYRIEIWGPDPFGKPFKMIEVDYGAR